MYDNTFITNNNITGANPAGGPQSVGGADWRFSEGEAATALGNDLLTQTGDGFIGLIDGLDIDPEQKEALREMILGTVADGQQPVDAETQATISAEFGDENAAVVQNMMDMLMEMVREQAREENLEESRDTDPSEAGGTPETGGGLNWFILLTKALAEIQSKWLTFLNAAYEKMQNSVGEGEQQQKDFITAQAEVTSYSKLFGMASETTSTVTKSIADGLTSVARKQ